MSKMIAIQVPTDRICETDESVEKLAAEARRLAEKSAAIAKRLSEVSTAIAGHQAKQIATAEVTSNDFESAGIAAGGVVESTL